MMSIKIRTSLLALALLGSLSLVALAPAASATGCIGMGQTNANGQFSCIGWTYQPPSGNGCIGIYDESQADVCDGIDP